MTPERAPRPLTPTQRGFTLIEVAVVLAIIGVVLVSVLQGRALIANAEYKSFKRSLGDYAEAFHVFRERYNALPGDFTGASADLDSSLGDGSGNGVIGTVGDPECGANTDENCLAWQHLRAASLLKGNPGDDGTEASPAHPYNGRVSGFFTGNEGNDEFGHKMLVEGLPAEIARRLDDETDDGLCNDGRISMNPNSACESSDWPSDLDAEVELVYAL